MNDSQLEVLVGISHYSHKSGRGIYILKCTDINQPQTLPVSLLEKYSWQLPVESLFHQRPPTHSV